MEDMILGFLDPYTKLVLGVSFAAVVFWRNAIRKRHIVMLLVVGVLAFIAFFALLLWSFGWYSGQKSLVVLHAVLGMLAGLFVGCSAAVGFSFILKSLGLASLGDAEPEVTVRRRR